MKKRLIIFITALLLTGIYLFFSCTKDTIFNPTDIPGVTIAAYVCDSTGLDTSLLLTGSLPDTVTALSPYAGQTVTFLAFIKGDSASIKDITWSWDFGDDSTSLSRVVEHRYMAAGTYKAVFTIANSVGVSLSDTVIISANGISPHAAVRGFAFFQGKSKHDGIEITIKSEGGTEYKMTSAESGLFQKMSNVPYGTYTVYYTDKKTGWFSPDTISNFIVNDGILNELGKVTLQDKYNPHIENYGPLGTINTRIPSIQASLIDTASGIAPETFVLVFNGDTIPDSLITVNDSLFSWKPASGLPNGIYSVYASIKDSAGNWGGEIWKFIVDAMMLSSMNDTVVDFGGSVRCSVYVVQNFGHLLFEIDSANTGSYKTIPDNDTFSTYLFNTGNVCSWDSVKVRVSDEDGNVVIQGFKVDVRPRPLTITSIDSTVNTLAVHFSQTQESDFTEYRIYRNTTNAVDTNSELWAKITSGTTTNYSITPSFNWIPRYYGVFQNDNEGVWSVGSNVVYGNIINSSPATPVITFPANDGDSVWADEVLRWTKCTDVNNQAVKYSVFINHNNSGYVQFVTGIQDTFARLQGFDSLEIKFKVIAYDSEEDSSTWSVERIAHLKAVVTDIDGTTYHTVIIGNQTWMIENFRSTRYKDGSLIPLVTDDSSWSQLTTPGYCYYNNTMNADSIKKFGVLYNWYAIGTKMLAPPGWHVPTNAEWDTLQDYLIANGYNWDGTTTGNKIAKSLAAKKDWTASVFLGAIGNDLTKNNKSGFSALPGGYRECNGNFYCIGDNGHWWNATESDTLIGGSSGLNCEDVSLFRNSNEKSCGFSVRLVKD